MIRSTRSVVLAIALANVSLACSSESEQATDSQGDELSVARARAGGGKAGASGVSSAGSSNAGSSAGSGGAGGSTSSRNPDLSSVDTWITSGVTGAKCYRLDANEGLFAGYPITKIVPLQFGATSYVGTLLGSSLLNWAAFATSDCTGSPIQSGLDFVPYKPGLLIQWTVTLK